MTATDPRARSLPLLLGGMATGILFAVLTVRPGSGLLALLLTALPFLLAALTGVAKTTTA